MLFAARKKVVEGEERLLMRFQVACMIADMIMRIIAKLDMDVTSSQAMMNISAVERHGKICT